MVDFHGPIGDHYTEVSRYIYLASECYCIYYVYTLKSLFSRSSFTMVLVLRVMTSSSTGGLGVVGGGGVALDTGGCGCGLASADVWLLTAYERES